MKIILVTIIALSLISSIIFPASLNVGKDKIVKVNNRIITLEELEKRYTEYSQMFPEGKGPSKKEILDQMINAELILEEAKSSKNIVLDENKFKQYLNYSKQLYTERMKKKDPNFVYSDDKFKQYLEKEEDTTYEKFEEKIKDTIIGEQYIMKKVEPKVNQLKEKKYTSPSDFPVKMYTSKGELKSYNSAKEYYDDNLDLFLLKSPVYVKHIYKATVSQSQNSNKINNFPLEEKARVKKIMDDIYARLIKGEKFDTLCELNSDDAPSRDYKDKKTGNYNRGYLGPIVKSAEIMELFGKELYEKIITLPVGKYSPVLEGKLGYHIFYVIDKKDHEILKFEDVQENIKNLFMQADYEQIVKSEYDKVLKELKQKASIVYYNEEYK